MAQQNLAVNLDEATYQAALARAQSEGKTLEQAMSELLAGYGQADKGVTSYTVQSGDTPVSYTHLTLPTTILV